MVLTNKKTTYSVNNSNLTVKLSGSIALNSENKVEYFNGSFLNIPEDEKEEKYLGNFDYSESLVDETFSKSIHGISFSDEENLLSLLNSTIVKIKTEVGIDILSE